LLTTSTGGLDVPEDVCALLLSLKSPVSEDSQTIDTLVQRNQFLESKIADMERKVQELKTIKEQSVRLEIKVKELELEVI
jgi:Tfp pilus assembly protein PilN